ncbi:MAG: protein arginine kinase [Planctomycetota bacterium]|nr:MAG: protein arginine kinase [Planctomycetota bacterium]
MDLEGLTKTPGEWLKGRGPESDIVISSRIRLARNIKGYPFVNRASSEQKKELWELLSQKIKKTGWPPATKDKELLALNLKEASEIDRVFLVERHLISKEHAAGHGDRGVVLDNDETLSIMINEEDHLRMQVMKSGFRIQEIWDEISLLDDELERILPFSFHQRYGYLTACPSNVGTGMRVSVMLHLPALVMTRHIQRVFLAVQKINFTVRGFYGEGTQAFGDFYQISNQVTLGIREEDILQSMSEIIPQIVKYERNIRETLLKDDMTLIEDRVHRAFGMLKSARILSSEEAMDLLSAVRMGINLRILGDVSLDKVNELFLFSQPGHLQKLEQKKLLPMERDILRASFIRNRLN